MGEFPQIDQVLRAAIDRGDVPGVVAMAATAAGPAYQGAFGGRMLPDGAEMTADTVFWIASMTKAITSAAARRVRAAHSRSGCRARACLARPTASPPPM